VRAFFGRHSGITQGLPHLTIPRHQKRKSLILMPDRCAFDNSTDCVILDVLSTRAARHLQSSTVTA
jgi:hypothetical protein